MPTEIDQTQTESATIAIADLGKLRDKVAALVPGVIPELIQGSTVDELLESIDTSHAIFERYNNAAATTPAAPAPPAQPDAATTPAPPVTPPAVPAGGVTYTEDLSALPGMELIRRGLKQRAEQQR